MTLFDSLRTMYHDEDPATDDEAHETMHEARTDPEQARKLLLLLYALAGEDRAFDELLQLVLKVGTMQLLIQASTDDSFALHMAELILEGMEQMTKAAERRRGRTAARKARGA